MSARAGATLGLAGFVAASVHALWPLPTVDALGGPAAWCGPGTSSASALRVATRPDVVNEGGGDATPEQRAALKQVCEGMAGERLDESGIAGAAGAVLGLGVWLLGDRYRKGYIS